VHFPKDRKRWCDLQMIQLSISIANALGWLSVSHFFLKRIILFLVHFESTTKHRENFEPNYAVNLFFPSKEILGLVSHSHHPHLHPLPIPHPILHPAPFPLPPSPFPLPSTIPIPPNPSLPTPGPRISITLLHDTHKQGVLEMDGTGWRGFCW